MTAAGRGRPRIAIVDDEPDYRAILARWLRPLYETVSYDSAEDLLESGGKDDAADLIISDVRMPGLDGFGLCELLREHPRYARVPVLFLTGVSSEEGLFPSQDAGASAYLTKPVERERLLEQIEKLLDAQAF